jgi:hypothetical protein
MTDGSGEAIDSESFDDDISVIEAAYQYRGADEQLTIIAGEATDKPSELLLEWME